MTMRVSKPLSKPTACRQSAACPAVATRRTALPSDCMQAWILGLIPPRLRPKHSVTGSLFLVGRVLVSAQHGRIDTT